MTCDVSFTGDGCLAFPTVAAQDRGPVPTPERFGVSSWGLGRWWWQSALLIICSWFMWLSSNGFFDFMLSFMRSFVTQQCACIDWCFSIWSDWWWMIDGWWLMIGDDGDDGYDVCVSPIMMLMSMSVSVCHCIIDLLSDQWMNQEDMIFVLLH